METVSEPREVVKMRPLSDRILVQPERRPNVVHGVHMPDTFEGKDEPRKGLVLAVGPGKWENGARVPMDVKPGDDITFSQFGGSSVKLGGEELLIIHERDVFTINEYA